MIKPSPTCWLYLNCEDMTGQPSEKCPNRRKCRVNAKHSENRSCDLPYWYCPLDFDFFSYGQQVLTVQYTLEPEAIAAGWQSAEPLPWHLQDDGLWIGFNPNTSFFIPVTQEAQAAGFDRAQHTPYGLNSKPGQIIVTDYAIRDLYPEHFLKAGWHPAINLPYYIIKKSRSNPDHSIAGLYVSFDIRDSAYKKAIAAGWYPALSLTEYDLDPDDEDDEDEYNCTEDEW